MKKDKFDLVRFTDNDFELDVRADSENETAWLTQEEIAILFNRNQGVISRHISSIYKEGELDRNTSMQKMHKSPKDSNPNYRPPVYYNLDVIISDYKLSYPTKVSIISKGPCKRAWNRKMKEWGLKVGQKIRF